jgi:hypothetical protein
MTTSGEIMLVSNCRMYSLGFQIKQWPTHHNSCIVHQADQIPVADHRADLPGSLLYRVGIRNVHQERHEAVAELLLQAIGVSLLADRAEDEIKRTLPSTNRWNCGRFIPALTV